MYPDKSQTISSSENPVRLSSNWAKTMEEANSPREVELHGWWNIVRMIMGWIEGLKALKIDETNILITFCCIFHYDPFFVPQRCINAFLSVLVPHVRNVLLCGEDMWQDSPRIVWIWTSTLRKSAERYESGNSFKILHNQWIICSRDCSVSLIFVLLVNDSNVL